VSANEHRRSINSDVILNRCAARILASDVIKGNPNSCAIILGMMMGLKYVLMFIHRLSQVKCLKFKVPKVKGTKMTITSFGPVLLVQKWDFLYYQVNWLFDFN